MIGFRFTPWGKFSAERKPQNILAWLQDQARTTHRILRGGMEGSKTGRVYRTPGGGLHRASAPGEYPAKRSGATAGSIRSEVQPMQETTGTGMFYDRFLKTGTRKMKPRKMTEQAHKEASAQVRARRHTFAGWKRG